MVLSEATRASCIIVLYDSITLIHDGAYSEIDSYLQKLQEQSLLCVLSFQCLFSFCSYVPYTYADLSAEHIVFGSNLSNISLKYYLFVWYELTKSHCLYIFVYGCISHF